MRTGGPDISAKGRKVKGATDSQMTPTFSFQGWAVRAKRIRLTLHTDSLVVNLGIEKMFGCPWHPLFGAVTVP